MPKTDWKTVMVFTGEFVGFKGRFTSYKPPEGEPVEIKAGGVSYRVKAVIVVSRKHLRQYARRVGKTVGGREWRRIRVKGKKCFVQRMNGKITLHDDTGRKPLIGSGRINRKVGEAIAEFTEADVEGLDALPANVRPSSYF